MSFKFKFGIIAGMILLVAAALLMFKVIVKLGALMMFIGFCFVLYMAAKFLFFRKKA